MKTVRVKVYEYSELNEKAQQEARYWLLESGLDGQIQWEDTQEDANVIGLKLEGTHRGYMLGKFSISAQECAKLILENHGQTCETWKDAFSFLWDIAIVWEKDFDVEADELTYDDETKIEDLESEFLKIILEDYRIISEKNQEYVESEEYIKETMEANGYTFTKDGKRFG
jgi:hypothetical protein